MLRCSDTRCCCGCEQRGWAMSLCCFVVADKSPRCIDSVALLSRCRSVACSAAAATRCAPERYSRRAVQSHSPLISPLSRSAAVQSLRCSRLQRSVQFAAALESTASIRSRSPTDQSPRCSHSQQRSAVSLAAALRPRCSEASLHCSPRCSHSHTLSSVAAMLSRGNGAAPRVAHLHVQHRPPSVPTRLDSTRTTQRLDWDAPAVVAPGRAAL